MEETRRLTLDELEQLVRQADPAVVLVAPRVLRRVIRLDRRITAFGFRVPHSMSYVILRERLFDCVTRFELELPSSRELSDTVLMLRRPDEEELQHRPAGEVLYEYWRHLFHVRVHLELQRRVAGGQLTEDDVLDRLRRIGAPQYAEIRSVLQRDDLLLPPRSDLSAYVEFAAVFFELRYFAPEQVPWNFPALADHDAVANVLGEDVDHGPLYAATRLAGAQRPEPRGEYDEPSDAAGEPLDKQDPLRPSPPAYWRFIARAERAGSVGNTVKAAVLRCKAARVALADRVQPMRALAVAELSRLAARLQTALQLTAEEGQEWAAALVPLLQHADHGFRSVESRLLYDLQKVCVEHERGVFTIDLLGWLRSLGRSPLRRQLSLLREVMVAQHLQRAARKLTTSRLTGPARRQLSQLIDSAVARLQQRVRERLRPVLVEALAAEGEPPRNVPERVAFRKIVEELLDHIVRRGYLSFGHIRDTLSQNNLKLPDLTRLRELVFGDVLLRLDRRLASVLDGVHHRGPIYLRWSHQLSALAFGTQFGRWLTRYLMLPFGGAFLGIEGVRHILHWFVQNGEPAAPVLEQEAESLLAAAGESPATALDVSKTAQVLLLGVFLLMLMEHPAFRAWCLATLRTWQQAARRLYYDLPVLLLRRPWVRKFFESPLYAVLTGYMLKPLVLALCLLLPFSWRLGSLAWSTWTTTFLLINLMLNSPLGRYADELIAEQVVRGLRGLQVHVIGAALRLILEAFQRLLQAVEQALYTVDEWLLFRTGERRLVLAAKAILGAVWSVINYFVRFCITLLIEPQVNPIKHFPVVTVSHKILIPFIPHLARLLRGPLGPVWAGTIAPATIFLLPGVFGFLVWELKENWRLYAANRSKVLKPIPIGRHGETMPRLLRLGFHSGTVPRLFTKLRAAGRAADRTSKWRAVHKHLAALQHVHEAAQQFAERELAALLAECPQWQGRRLEVAQVHLAFQQIIFELRRPDVGHHALRLVIQERSGWIVAWLASRGWLDALPDIERQAFLGAVTGFYKSAGVDLIWERVLEHVGRRVYWYDINSDGLLFWRDGRYSGAELYKLRDTGATAALTMPLRAVVEPDESVLDGLLFRRSPLPWETWVAMWESPDGAARSLAASDRSPPQGGVSLEAHPTAGQGARG